MPDYSTDPTAAKDSELRRENESARIRERALGLVEPAPAAVTSAHTPDSAPARRLSQAEQDKDICDELLRNVGAQNHGVPLPPGQVANSQDIVNVHHATERNPPRRPYPNELFLVPDRDVDHGGRKAKPKKHNLYGQAGYDILERYVRTIAQGTARAVSAHIETGTIDEHSGVDVPPEDGEVSEAESEGAKLMAPEPPEMKVMGRYHALLTYAAEFVRAGKASSLEGREVENYVMMLVEDINGELTRNCTVTAAFENVSHRRHEVVVRGARRVNRGSGTSGRVKDRRRDHSSDGDDDSSSSGSSSEEERRPRKRRRSTGGSDKKKTRPAKRSKSGDKRKRKGSSDAPPFGLCFDWAQKQVGDGDGCPKSSSKCKYRHKFEKESEKKWARKKWGK